MPNPPADFLTDCYQDLWKILEAFTPFEALVKPANRIKYDGGRLVPTKSNKMDSDFPEVTIRARDFDYAMFGPEDVTMATNAIPFNPSAVDWQEYVTQFYEITVAYNDLRISSNNPVELQILRAFRNAGPRLGLSYVIEFGPFKGKREETKKNEAAGRLRSITRMLFPVKMLFEGSSLL